MRSAAKITAAIFVLARLAGGQSSPLQITTTALPNGSVGASYGQAIAVTGGAPPYTWTLSSGSLPTGLTFFPNGTISGVPTHTETQEFTVQVTDSKSNSVKQAFSIQITPPICFYKAVSAAPILADGTGFAGSFNVTTLAGCTLPLTVSSNAILITNVSVVSSALVGGPTDSGPVIVAVDYLINSNNTGSARTTTILLEGQPFYSIQQPPVAVPTYVGSFPHLVSGGGWSTTFTFVNKSSAAYAGDLNIFDDNGSPMAVPVVTLLPLTYLESLMGYQMSDSIAQLLNPGGFSATQVSGPGDPQYREGFGRQFITDSVDGFAIFHYGPSNQEAVVPMETRNAASYVLPFDNTNGVSTGIAIANIAFDTATISVAIRDDTGAFMADSLGTVIAHESLPPLNGNARTSFVLSTQFPQTAGRRGTIEFDTPGVGSSNPGQISVLGIRYTPPGTLTTIPALVNVGTAGGTMAHVAVGNGWQTTFVLVNTGSEAASATLRFFGDDGSPLPVELAFPQNGTALASPAASYSQSIAAGASLWVTATGLAAFASSGSAQLTATGDVGGFAIFRYNTNGQEAVVPMETRNASSYLIAFDNTLGTTTGVAIANATGQGAAIPVTLRDTMGNSIGTSSVTLRANGHTSFMLSDMFPQAGNIHGTAEFGVPSGGSISVLGIRSPPALTFTTLPALAK